MVFKWILAPLAAIFLAASAAILPAHGGSDIAGTVPQFLEADGVKNAKSHECTLGDAVADAARSSLSADIAIICGGDLEHNLLPGDITWDGLRAIFKEDRPLASAAVTPMELRGILEAGLSHITLDKTETIDSVASAYDGFPQVSGFTMSYDAAAAPGSRVHEINLKGKRLDLNDETTVLRLAATEHMLSGGYGLPAVSGARSSGLTLSGALASYMNHGMTEYVQRAVRIYPMSARDGSLNSVLPVGIVFVVILLIAIGNGQRLKRMVDFNARGEN